MNLYDKTLHCKNIKHHEHDEILNEELIKILKVKKRIFYPNMAPCKVSISNSRCFALACK